IEKLAKRSGREEYDVAQRAIDMACEMSAADGAVPALDIGDLLVGPGRVRLEQDLGCTQPLRTRAVRFMRRLGWPGMALSILALTLLLMWATTVALAEYGLTPGALWMLVLLFALPAS